MELRPATMEELPELLEIYRRARAFMADAGNPSQWAGGYPPGELVESDIRNRSCYVCAEGTEILGVFSYFTEPDPTYSEIYGGAWRNDGPYGTIHRVAVKTHGRGVAAFIFSRCFAACGNLRIDTHRDNIPMQKALAKSGFVRCGIIHLQNGEERIAFQKTE